MNAFKQRCLELRKKDYSLLEIMKATGRPKTSVYFHIKNIPLSRQKQRSIQEASRKRARIAGLRRKGKSRRPFKEFKKWNITTVHIVSHFLFDGEIRSTGCVYHNRSSSLVNSVGCAMKEIYEFPPKRSINNETGVIRLGYYNVALAAHIKQTAEELPSQIGGLSKECKREFLRSFFDDEGCMDFRPKENRKRVRGYQKNKGTLRLIQTLLGDFGIASGIKEPNEVVIVGKENLKKFEKEVNFSPGVKVNGKRTNSIWKKNLEKRKLLRKAIESYQT